MTLPDVYFMAPPEELSGEDPDTMAPVPVVRVHLQLSRAAALAVRDADPSALADLGAATVAGLAGLEG